jgi:hypothetical protein
VGTDHSVSASAFLFDGATARPIGVLERAAGGRGVPSAVAFSPDGASLALQSDDQHQTQITIWDTSVPSWLARACRVAGRNLTHEEWTQYVGPEQPYERTCPEWPAG